MHRRAFLGAVTASLVAARGGVPRAQDKPPALKGRIKQGVTRGVFARGTSIEDCCKLAAPLGIKGFDLIGPADWPTLKKYGLVPSMYPRYRDWLEARRELDPNGVLDGPFTKRVGISADLFRP